MKKILLTTSALTLLAGAAAADISLSGTGRIGVVNVTGTDATVPGAPTTTGTNVTHRFRINVNASGETDGGLKYGAYVRVNMNGGAVGAVGAPRLWIGNGMATLTVGNAGGAVATAGNIWGCGVGFTGACADIPNASFSWASHSSGGAGPSVIRLDMNMGAAKISVSGGNASGGTANDTEVAATFNLGSAKIGISHDAGAGATGGNQVHVGFAAGGAKIGIHMAQSNGTTAYTATVGYGVGGGSLYLGGGTQLNAAATATNNTTFVSYSMPLGGGASAVVSYRKTGSSAVTDAGVKFKF